MWKFYFSFLCIFRLLEIMETNHTFKLFHALRALVERERQSNQSVQFILSINEVAVGSV